MSLRNILWKTAAVIVITLGGAAITCGGNLMIGAKFFFDIFGDFLYVIWFIEIFAIFIWSVRRFFFQTQNWSDQPTYLKWLIFLIPLFGGIFIFYFLMVISGI